MSVVVMESGAYVLMAKYLHQKQQGGVWYYRRRLPDEIRKHYPDIKTGILFYSLKTKDEREAARKANQDALQQDALWKAIREGQIAHGPEVIAAAEELLRTHGLKPGDGCGEKGKNFGLEPFQDFLHGEAVSLGAPRDSSEAENEENHWREYLPPVHRTAGDLLFSAKRPVFLSEALKAFQERKGETTDTKAGIDRVRTVNEFISIFGDLPVDRYSRENANGFVQYLLGKGNKPETVQRRLNSIRPVFKDAVLENELEDRRIFESIKVPNLGQDAKERLPFSDDEIRHIQETCMKLDDELRWIVAMLSDTGMRLAEVVGLKTEDIVLNVPVPYLWVRPNEARSLKTKGSERRVPLVGASLWAAKKALARQPGSYVFPRYIDENQSKPDCKATHASNTLNKWIRTLEIKDKGSKGNHSFRHSVQDRLRAKETPLEIRNAICGWKNPGVGQGYGQGYPMNVLAQHMSQIVLISTDADRQDFSVT